jgi:hypothetical protein
MKFVLSALVLLFSISSLAAANVTIKKATKDELMFDFDLAGCGSRCVGYTNLMAESGFPTREHAQKVRFVFSQGSFDKIYDESTSMHVEVPIMVDANGNVSIGLIDIAHLARGRWFFKAAVIDDLGAMIFMTPDYASDPFRHSIVIP